MVSKGKKTLFQIFLLATIFSMAGCSVIPVAPGPVLVTLTPTPNQTATPIPATNLEIGIVSQDINPDFHAYLVDDSPAPGDVIFQNIAHPGLFKMNPQTKALVPLIAEKPVVWKAGDQGWTTHIGFSNAWQWSDGSRLTARDIIFSFQTYQSCNYSGR